MNTDSLRSTQINAKTSSVFIREDRCLSVVIRFQLRTTDNRQASREVKSHVVSDLDNCGNGSGVDLALAGWAA